MDFRILGPLEVRADDTVLALGGGKQRALLVLFLLRRGAVVSTEQAIDALWGERPPASAANSVHVYVSQLRRVLGSERLLTRGHGYVLELEPGELDSERFETLLADGRTLLAAGDASTASETFASALSLWRGAPLGELGFESFVQPGLARLEELRVSALEGRIEADLARGVAAPLVPELEALVSEHPHRERLRGQLMLALYRTGRQAEALASYRDGRRLLVEELGLEPGPELQELERAILRQDPLLRPLEGSPAGRRASRTWTGILVVAGAVVFLAAAVAAALVELSSGSAAVTVLPSSVAAINPATNRVVADVAVGTQPVAVAAGYGAVWVANNADQTVSRVDPVKLTEVTIGIGADVSDVAVGFGSVWVANGNDGTLSRIDARTNAILRTLRFGGVGLVSAPVFSVATGAGAVWITRGNRLLRIDPASNEVVMRIPVELPLGLTVGGGYVWVTTRIGHVVRVEPTTGQVSDVIPLAAAATAPEVGDGSLWVIADRSPPTIWALDPDTGSLTGGLTSASASSDLAWGDGSLWAAGDGTVTRISGTGERIADVHVGQPMTGVAVNGSLVWATAGAAAD